MSPEDAFKQSSESITGPITKTISKEGILKLYEGLDKPAQEEFKVSPWKADTRINTALRIDFYTKISVSSLVWVMWSIDN